MIEPQNTMMPLPAESAPADVAHGEAGFGEMLAQTLGMIPQIDANAVQKLTGDSGEQGDEAGDFMAGGSFTEPKQDHAPVGRFITLPRDGSVSVSAPIPVASRPVPVVTPPAVDAEFVNPVFEGNDVPVTPVLESEIAEVVLPTPPQPDPAIDDGIWQPVLADEPQAAVAPARTQPVVAETTPTSPVTAPTAPAAEPTPVVVEPKPFPEPAPVAPQAPVGAAVIGGSDPVAVEPVRNLNPSNRIKPVHDLEPMKPTRSVPDPVNDRGLPTMPRLDVAEPLTGEVVRPTQAPTAVTVEPRVGLPIDSPVRLDQGEFRVPAPSPVSAGESTATVDKSASSAPGGMNVLTTDAGAPQTAPVSSFGAPDAPAQNSALAERVIQAVEMQANQPPPRTMVVDIPEIEGLRLVVSVRSGAEVHVVPSTGSTAADGLQSFLEELQGVLENRGFVMTGDGRRRGNNPNQDEQPEPRRAAQPTFRRPEPTDNDLRI